jgi:hypothetical protein
MGLLPFLRRIMPRVCVPNYEEREVHEVDDSLYSWFLEQVVLNERSIEDVLISVNPSDQVKLNNYIIYRLLEVDPGYLRPLS